MYLPRRAPFLAIGLVAGLIFGSSAVGMAQASPTRARSEGLAVVEQNLDADGNIRVRQQGSVEVTDGGGVLTVDGDVEVANLPPAPVPTYGSFVFGTGLAGVDELSFPPGVLVTDIVVAYRGDECIVDLIAEGAEIFSIDWAHLEGDVVENTQHELHFATGLPIDEIVFTTSGSGRCGGRLVWTGVVEP